MGYQLRCPACRVKFAWDLNKGFPEYCPNEECQTRIAHDRADDDIVVPFIRTTGKTAAIDKTYRDMEKSSEYRAEIAGSPELKITDLRPTKHEGDIAAPSLTGSAKALEDHMAQMNARGGQFGFGAGSNGSEWAAGTGAGPAPYSGAKTRTALQDAHRQLTRGAAVSDMPAKETQQPGYVRRG